jgi:hypothetical protein
MGRLVFDGVRARIDSAGKSVFVTAAQVSHWWICCARVLKDRDKGKGKEGKLILYFWLKNGYRMAISDSVRCEF